jgi:hypothetical protein
LHPVCAMLKIPRTSSSELLFSCFKFLVWDLGSTLSRSFSFCKMYIQTYSIREPLELL